MKTNNFLIVETFNRVLYKKLLIKDKLITENFDFERELIDSEKFEDRGYEIRVEKVKLSSEPESAVTKMKSAYSIKDNGYIGDPKTAKRLYEMGIVPELIDSEHNVCSVGFCEKEEKWYGWSHRAISGFGLGDKLFEEKHITSPNKNFVECGTVTIENLDQARLAAVNFANYVA